MSLVMIKKAEELKQNNQYFISDNFKAYKVSFAEVKPEKSDTVWSTNEVSNAQFIGYHNGFRGIVSHDRFKLFNYCKEHNIKIYEEK